MSKKNSCKIISLNVRGIRNSIKRSSIFTYLRDQKAVFYFLQETYSEPGDELFWKMNGEAKSIFRTALDTVKVFAYFSIHLLRNKTITEDKTNWKDI